MTTRARIAGLAVFGAVLLGSTAGCSLTVGGGGEGEGAVDLSAEASATGTPGEVVEGQTGADDGGDVDVRAGVGDCLSLTGTAEEADAERVDCDDPVANYRVVSTAPDEDTCPADVDQIYYEQTGATTTGALCLDRNWKVDTCYQDDEVAGEYVVVDCSGAGGLRYVATVPDASTPEECPEPADTSLHYATRGFIACFEEMAAPA